MSEKNDLKLNETKQATLVQYLLLSIPGRLLFTRWMHWWKHTCHSRRSSQRFQDNIGPCLTVLRTYHFSGFEGWGSIVIFAAHGHFVCALVKNLDGIDEKTILVPRWCIRWVLMHCFVIFTPTRSLFGCFSNSFFNCGIKNVLTTSWMKIWMWFRVRRQ
jgi:hypothetical protein